MRLPDTKIVNGLRIRTTQTLQELRGMKRWLLSWMEDVRYWYAEHEKLVSKFKEPRGGGRLIWPI